MGLPLNGTCRSPSSHPFWASRLREERGDARLTRARRGQVARAGDVSSSACNQTAEQRHELGEAKPSRRSGAGPRLTADVAARARDASRCQRGAPDGVDGAWTMRVYETDQDDEVDFFMSNNVTRQSG